MSEVMDTSAVLSHRPRLSLRGFNRRHRLMTKRAKALLGDSAVPKPIQVVLTDGTGWQLDHLDGVDWHLSRSSGERRTVSSARVADLPSKWDHK